MSKRIIAAAVMSVALFAGVASAEIIEGVNWADGVFDHSANIQNYGGQVMNEATEWWLTGPSDADANSNGYAWDAEDQDTIGGWRSSQPSEYITMYWEAGIPDLAGADLLIHLYGGSKAAANVSASVDGSAFQAVGTIGGGTEGYLRDAACDFAGLFTGDVHYAKVSRTASGSQTGMFFDSFAGVVPEPASLALAALGLFGVRRHRR